MEVRVARGQEVLRFFVAISFSSRKKVKFEWISESIAVVVNKPEVKLQKYSKQKVRKKLQIKQVRFLNFFFTFFEKQKIDCVSLAFDIHIGPPLGEALLGRRGRSLGSEQKKRK